jgi:GT2 family glycosyltransferase/lipopolysaccharide/colanic/teichoic acid biosynthesis glycosyltransferase
MSAGAEQNAGAGQRAGADRRLATGAVMPEAKFAIVIISYNTRKLIRRCLESLRAFAPRCAMEVLVVDNASYDGSVEMLAQEFPWVWVLPNRRNLGYAAAVNQGLEATRGEYVLILNPDIVVRDGSLDQLVDFLDRTPDCGIAAAKLLNTDGTLQHSCRSFYTPRTLLMRRTPLGKLFPNSPIIRHHLMLDYDHTTPRAVDWVIGACMLVRRSAAEAVGGMDERFFLYFEDVDWCFRMSRQGWKVWYLPQSEMVHEHRRDSAKPKLSRSFWAHLGSLLRYYEKWNRYAYGAKRYREPFKVAVFVLADLLATNVAFFAAYGLRVVLAGSFANPLYTLENYHNFWVFTNIVVLLALYFSGQYRIGRGKHGADELLDVGRALLVAVVVLMASTYVARERLISRAVVVLFFVLGAAAVWAFRRGLRALHARLLEMHLDLRRVAVVGTAAEAREVRALVAARPSLGLEVVGHVTVDADGDRRALGDLGQLADVVRTQRVQQVLVAPSAAQVEAVARMLSQLRHKAVEVQVMSGFADLLSHRARVERLADVPVLAFGRDTLHPLNAFGKRLADITGAVILLVVGSLPAVVYSAVARARGVPLYRRERRLGRDACPFDLPRVSGDLGLPASDLVNLPAFLAVLRGQMSFVGPYPMPSAVVPELADWQRLRFDVRPGLTGFWRTLPAHEVDLERVVRLDLHYVQNWSAGLDFRLLLQSLGHMLSGRGTQLDLVPAP